MAYLKCSVGGRQERFRLGADVVSIGRSPASSVVLPHPQVSREHARIVKDRVGFVLEDLGSRHGTRVNGDRIRRPTMLREQDVIGICDYSLHVRLEVEARDPLRRARTDLSAEPAAPDAVIMTTIDATVEDSVHCGVRPEAKLRALLEINRALHSTLAVDELLSGVLDGVLRIFPQAHHALALVLDGSTGELVPKASKSRGGDDDSLRLSRTAVSRALERKEGVLSGDASRDVEFEASESISELGIRSILCAPLLNKSKEALGVLHLHSESQGGRFDEEDLDVLVSVAITTALALENVRLHEEDLESERFRRETELAWDVQRRFLPARVPELPGYEFYHFYEAARSVGGDYYGFVELPDHRLAVAVGDVSGKGVPAAMLMARLSSDVRYALLTSAGPAEALQAVNRSLSEAGIEAQFVSLVLMVLDWERHTLTLANAGHPPPVLRDVRGDLQELGVGEAGLPLNVSLDPDYTYSATEVALAPGMTVLAYTDGVTEARAGAGEMFGQDRFFSVVKRAPSSAGEAGEYLINSLSDFVASAPQHDDTTLICFGRAL